MKVLNSLPSDDASPLMNFFVFTMNFIKWLQHMYTILEARLSMGMGKSS